MIIIITQCFYPVIGGLENLMTGLAESLSVSGREVVVFADGIDHPEDKIKKYKIFRFSQWKPIRKRKKAKAIKQFIKGKKIECIFVDSWKSIEFFNPGDINEKINVLAHGSEVLKQKENNNFLQRIKYQYKLKRIYNSYMVADNIIANSNYTKKIIEKNIGIKKNITIILPGVDKIQKNISEDDKKRIYTKLKNYSPILITLARLEERKGHLMVFDLISNLKSDFPKLKYLIAGDGPVRDHLEKYAKSIGVIDNVEFLGFITDPQKTFYLGISDIFIMTPYQVKESIEGFGMSYIDASMNGLPVIATKSGGIEDAVIDGINGFLINENDIKDLEDKTRLLLINNEIYQDISTKAKELSKSFIWENKIKEYLEV